ncbi:MAG: GntR family transcriptional regulator [Pirellulales bacterium]
MTLSDTVYADLAARIESGEGPPSKLTFKELAKHYGVSLTPVRAAVARLLDEGYLITRVNGRLQVSPSPPKRPAAARRVAVEPRRNHEAEILADIIRLSLSGDSRFFREAAAAKRYGIGRTVLRPILSRLAGQGLLEHVPRRGWRVRAFDRQDLRDFLVVRETLELAALEAARDQLDNRKLEEFLEGNREREGQLGGLNNNLHAYWIKLSGNRYIIEFFERQALYYTTLFDFAAPEAHVVQEMAAEHCAILEPLIAGNFGEAKQALVRHIRDQQPIVERLIEQIQSRAAATKK